MHVAFQQSGQHTQMNFGLRDCEHLAQPDDSARRGEWQRKNAETYVEYLPRLRPWPRKRQLQNRANCGRFKPGLTWRSAQIHQAILTAFGLSPDTYGLTQLRYDLRKLKAHGLLERDARRYCYRLTEKGAKVALMMTLFHKRVCGPLANSLFHHRPAEYSMPNTKIEAAYHKADKAIQHVVDLLAAA
jgi:hypothetical protein